MRFVDEYRDPAAAARLLSGIRRLAGAEPLRVMEICGSHTHVIFRTGLDQVLAPAVEFVHGPGCPVCVTPRLRVDQAIALARRPGTIIATYGDMLRVPGRGTSLRREAAKGARVKIVYSSLDAVRLARAHPDAEVVFFAVGFETTTPANGYSILEARRLGLGNFSVLANHVLVPPVIRTLLDDPETRVDAFIGPGHVSTIVGKGDYTFASREYGRPVVISGFEQNDILQAVYMLLRQRAEGRCEVEVQYTRAVRAAGNARARALVERVFTLADQEWRGLGVIPQSGLTIRPEFAAYDAAVKFRALLPQVPSREPAACICARIVKGTAKPFECPSFGTACTPERPLGACMVSSEGTCAAYHRYRGVPERGPRREVGA